MTLTTLTGCEDASLATVGHRPVRHSLTFGERQMLPMDAAGIALLAASPAERLAMVRDARRVQATFRATYGYVGAAALLTAPAAQAKLSKSAAPTYGLSLMPASGLGEYAVAAFGRPVNLCPMATAGCEAACLNTAGKGRLSSVQRARMVRSMFLLLHPVAAGVLLAHEIARAAARHAAPIRVRLNVLSDVRWELILPGTIRALQALGVRFYDYTKWSPAKRSAAAGLVHLTYSASERMTMADIVALHDAGHGVAVVFAASKATVKAACKAGATWHGMRLVDGLSTDDRTTDPAGGCIVALSALGDGLHDASGFVWEWTLAA